MDIQQCEIVKERLLELIDLLNIPNLPAKQKGTLMVALPLLKMGIQHEETQKLLRFLTCLNEMLRDVCDLDCSRPEYEDRMASHIETMAALITGK